MKIVYGFIGLILFFSQCSTSQHNQNTVDTIQAPVVIAPLDTTNEMTRPVNLGGHWIMESMPGSDTGWNTRPILEINVNEGSFNGNTGCNGISGNVTIQGTSIRFDNEIISTKMACSGKYNEKLFLNNLLKVNNFSVTDTTLRLKQLDTIKMIFRRRLI